VNKVVYSSFVDEVITVCGGIDVLKELDVEQETMKLAGKCYFKIIIYATLLIINFVFSSFTAAVKIIMEQPSYDNGAIFFGDKNMKIVAAGEELVAICSMDIVTDVEDEEEDESVSAYRTTIQYLTVEKYITTRVFIQRCCTSFREEEHKNQSATTNSSRSLEEEDEEEIDEAIRESHFRQQDQVTKTLRSFKNLRRELPAGI
jgi:hypothetical protein